MGELGELLGFLSIVAIAGTIMNYCVKLVNKRFGKKISAKPNGKKLMKSLMFIFVRNHKFFGIAALILLLPHAIIQFSNYGLNVTGGVIALLMIVQLVLGAYAIIKKKPRNGAWFITHRIIALLFIFGIGLHLLAPNSLNSQPVNEISNLGGKAINNPELQEMTLDELSKYNGIDGNKAYVAYKGLVYDVSEHPKWGSGKHNGINAGTDLTDLIKLSPHGDSKFADLEIVGKIK